MVDFRGVTFADGVSDSAVALVSCHVPAPGGLDGLIGDFAGDFEDDVEEEEGNVSVEGGGGWGIDDGGSDEGEEIVEKGGPLVDVGAQEKKSEGMGEFVSEDWGGVSGEGEMRKGGVQGASASAGPLTYSAST